MPAKILAFDSNRRIPPRHYTPIAMRGRLLVMPSRSEMATAVESNSIQSTSLSVESGVQECLKAVSPASNLQAAISESSSLRW